MNVPLAKRIALQDDTQNERKPVSGRFGAKEFSFVPKSSKKKAGDSGGEGAETPRGRGKRRGIRELGLKRQKM